MLLQSIVREVIKYLFLTHNCIKVQQRKLNKINYNKALGLDLKNVKNYNNRGIFFFMRKFQFDQAWKKIQQSDLVGLQ
ncbi:unnamed protein product [Paramecium sonneborni]|uniref:Uncharacterized protein n=1 Tax=Paramecium sonneborni TaxID=65129 RepID=A0A8S1R161_9CILI|nr:unnamed protein product [Paramecium sonneborni]